MVAIRFDNLISNTLLAATGGSKTNVFRLGATGRGMVHDKEYYKEEYRKFRLKKSRSIFGMKKPINLIDGVKPREKSRKLSSLRPGSNLNAGSQHESKSKWNREKETKTSRRRGRRRRRRMNEWEKEREKERGMGRRWRWCNPFEWFTVWWEPRNWVQFSFLVFYYIFDYQSRCFFSFLLLFFQMFSWFLGWKMWWPPPFPFIISSGGSSSSLPWSCWSLPCSFPFFSIFFFYLILYFFGWCINGELPTLWWDDFCSRCALIDSSNLGTAPLFKENNPSAWSSSTSFGLSPSVLGLLLFNFLHSSSMKSLFYESRLLQWEMSVNEHRWVWFVVFHFLFLAFMLVQFVWPCQFVTSQSIVLIFDQHPMTCSISTVARNSADIFIKSTLHWSNQIWLDQDKFNGECNSFNVS